MYPFSASARVGLVALGSTATAWCLLAAPVWVSSAVVGVEALAWCWWLERAHDSMQVL